MPVFTPGDKSKRGMTNRQCTRDYKIDPIRKRARELMGYSKGKWLKEPLTMVMGITTDEARRATQPDHKYIEHDYPLITELKWTRWDCANYLKEMGIKASKSSCVFCPYKSNQQWRLTEEGDFRRSVEFDEKVRNVMGRRDGYLHRSLVPLSQANLEKDQMDMFGETCDGFCGV